MTRDEYNGAVQDVITKALALALRVQMEQRVPRPDWPEWAEWHEAALIVEEGAAEHEPHKLPTLRGKRERLERAVFSPSELLQRVFRRAA